MHLAIIDHAIAHADGVVQGGQHLAPRGRLDPQAQPADLNCLFVQVHAVQIILQDLPVEVEERLVSAQLHEPIVRRLESRVQLVKGFNQEGAAPAGRIQQAEAAQHLLPRFPKADQRLALRPLQVQQVVCPRIGKGLGGGADSLACVGNPQLLKPFGKDSAEALFHDVAGDEMRRVERPLFLPPGLVLFLAQRRRPGRRVHSATVPGP